MNTFTLGACFQHELHTGPYFMTFAPRLVSMQGMRSAEYHTTISLAFLIIIHNYANVLTINQSKSLPGFRVVTSLDGINGRSIQTLLKV